MRKEKDSPYLLRNLYAAPERKGFAVLGGEEAGEMAIWHITMGQAGRLCVVPKSMLEGRKTIRTIECGGIRDALKKLKEHEENRV